MRSQGRLLTPRLDEVHGAERRFSGPDRMTGRNCGTRRWGVSEFYAWAARCGGWGSGLVGI